MSDPLKKAERSIMKQLNNPFITEDQQRGLLAKLKRVRTARRK